MTQFVLIGVFASQADMFQLMLESCKFTLMIQLNYLYALYSTILHLNQHMNISNTTDLMYASFLYSEIFSCTMNSNSNGNLVIMSLPLFKPGYARPTLGYSVKSLKSCMSVQVLFSIS